MGTCVIVDADNRIRVHCTNDAKVGGQPIVCNDEVGCLLASVGHTRRCFDGPMEDLLAALETAGMVGGRFWEWAWDGETFTELGPIE
jgi:hypothetical protein